MPVWRDDEVGARDQIEDVSEWIARAVAACELTWERTGRRYARRLDERNRRRHALRDVSVMAARRCLPLTRALTRPLPLEGLTAAERGFNALDPADRQVLGSWDVGAACRGARGEHVASALQRLLVSVTEQEREDERAERKAGDILG